MSPVSTSERELLDLVALIYDAAVDRSLWPGVLAAIACATNSASTSLLLDSPPNHARDAVPELVVHAVDPEFQRAFAEHYWRLDPWAGRMTERDIGVPLPGRAVLSLHELQTTEFYADCWERYGGYLDSFSVSLRFRGPTLASALSGARSARAAEYKDHELEVLRPLTPHLQRAIAIDAQLRAARDTSDALGEALDRLELAVLMLDANGCILRANRAAERMLAENDGLCGSATGLSAADPGATRVLRQLLGEVVETGSSLRDEGTDGGLAAGGWLALPRPSGRRDLIAMVAPASARRSPDVLHAGTVALVFVTDPESRPETWLEGLQRLWRLTSAEAELACALMSGASLQEVSEQAEISRNTAKTQLASVFAKTRTHRQGELVALLNRTVGTLNGRASITVDAARPAPRTNGRENDSP